MFSESTTVVFPPARELVLTLSIALSHKSLINLCCVRSSDSGSLPTYLLSTHANADPGYALMLLFLCLFCRALGVGGFGGRVCVCVCVFRCKSPLSSQTLAYYADV
jgi:hypothetical protein